MRDGALRHLGAPRPIGFKSAFFDCIWECSPDPMLLAELSFDWEGHPQDCSVLDINPSAVACFGLARTQATGRSVSELLPECAHLLERKLAQVSDGPASPQLPETASVQGRWHDIQVIPLDTDHRFVTIVCRSRDFTGQAPVTCSTCRRSSASTELEAARLLQDLSTRLIQEDDVDALYDHVLITVMKILHADFGSIQIYHPEHGPEGAVRLHCHRGFDGFDLSAWEWVAAGARSSCGLAIRTRRRVVLKDVLQSELMAGGRYLEDYRNIGVRAVQTTPLLSRTGALLGLFSAYWRAPRELTPSESRCLDIIARQTADLVERTQSEGALRESKLQLDKARTEALALVEKLCLVDEKRTAFLAMLSHELRNPLAAITMSNSLLKRLPPDCVEAAKARDVIDRQTAQLSRLVDDLLDVTRITRNRLVLQREPVLLDQLVKTALLDYEPLFAQKGVILESRLNEGPVRLLADPARLIQAIGNLLNNALKFTPQGGRTTATLAVCESQNEAVFTVSDTGVGIEPDLLPQLFEPFVQADSAARPQTCGIGLGLALVRGIAELHGGSVAGFSRGSGKGAEFTMRLPLSIGSDNSPDASKTLEATLSRPVRVLVIEDNPDFAEIMAQLLNLLCHEVVLAHSGSEGVTKAKEYQPEVILCDLGLPGMDGYEVATRLRSDPELAECILIALSGYAQPEDVARSLAAGFDRHLAKPLDLAVLQRLLEEVGRSRS